MRMERSAVGSVISNGDVNALHTSATVGGGILWGMVAMQKPGLSITLEDINQVGLPD